MLKLKLLNDSLHNILSKIFAHFQLNIYIGSFGTLIVAIKRNKIFDFYFIGHSSEHELEKCNEFFKKYSKTKIHIIIDDKVKLEEVNLPIIDHLGYRSAIQSFINKNFDSSEIVAYKVTQLSQRRSSNSINIAIANTELSPPITGWLDKIFSRNKYSLGGIYFMAFEAENIIKFLSLKDENISTSENILNILITPTYAGGIKSIALYKSKVIMDKTTPYPFGKSLEYLQGIIENEASEAIYGVRKIVAEQEIPTQIIILTSEELTNLISLNDINADYKNILKIEDFIQVKTEHKQFFNPRHFSDLILANIFAKHKNYNAKNSKLTTLINLSWLNQIIFKPILIGAIGIILYAGKIQFQVLENQGEIHNKQQLLISAENEYRNIKQKYDKINDFDAIIDVIALQMQLLEPQENPNEVITNLLKFHQDMKIEIEEIKWKILEANKYQHPGKSQIIIDVNFLHNNNEQIEMQNILKSYIHKMREKFSAYTATYRRSKKHHANLFNIPVTIILTQKAKTRAQ